MSLWPFVPQPRLGREIREARTGKGWSQSKLAAAIGMPGSQSQISGYERGETVPTDETVHKIAGALGVPLERFMEERNAYGAGSAPHDSEEETDDVQELIDTLSAPASVRVYGTAGVSVDAVMRGAMQHALDLGWDSDKLARLATLREILIQKAKELDDARSAAHSPQGARSR